MSAITPQTELRLLKCPIESDNRNQLTFANATAQYNYFNSLPHITADNFTYQRKDSVIRYPAHIDSIMSYNYVMYQNENYTDKWFYAFITGMEYVNDNMTLISIKTDVYQSWLFQMEWKNSFIEREHVNDDTLGLHTIPENVELGQPKVYATLKDSASTSLALVTQSLIDPDSHQDVDKIHEYHNIPIPGKYNRWDTRVDGKKDLQEFINWLDTNSKKDALVQMFLAPTWILGAAQGGSGIEVEETNTIPSVTLGISRIYQLDGYTPKNNKLLTYPYCYIALSNQIGQMNIYKQERWELDSNNEMLVIMKGCLTPGCSVKALPLGYNGEGYGKGYVDEGISLGKYPILAWSSDTYTNWLTQNGVNLGFKAAGAITGVVGGAALSLTGAGAIAGASMIAGGLGMVSDSIKEVYQHSLVPDSIEGSLNSGDILNAYGENRLTCYRMGVTQEYAKIIDQYFSSYGYKVNTVKIPNLTGRTNWNYVKTIGANIEGDIPEDHLNEIKTIFNNGVTLWHNASTYLDYSQSNTIVS